MVDADRDPARVAAILANLAAEIGRPLDALEAGLAALLVDADPPPSDVERGHATTMLSLCGELRRLTAESLTGAPPPAGGET